MRGRIHIAPIHHPAKLGLRGASGQPAFICKGAIQGIRGVDDISLCDCSSRETALIAVALMPPFVGSAYLITCGGINILLNIRIRQ